MLKQPILHIADIRMLQLMDYCIANKLRDLATIKTWCEVAGVSRTNIYNIRQGMQRFTVDHIHAACTFFGVSTDFIFGFSNEMIRPDVTASPLDRIKEAVNQLENEQKKAKTVEFKPKKKTG